MHHHNFHKRINPRHNYPMITIKNSVTAFTLLIISFTIFVSTSNFLQNISRSVRLLLSRMATCISRSQSSTHHKKLFTIYSFYEMNEALATACQHRQHTILYWSLRRILLAKLKPHSWPLYCTLNQFDNIS